MLNERIVALRDSEHGAWWISGLVGLLLIAAAALGGLIQQYFSGEEFLIYHYANNLPHYEAWQQFFFQNGRLIEALFWTYQYKVLGYQPLLFHVISFVLLLTLSLLATACFLNVWPQERRSQALPYLFIFLLFFSWILNSSVLRLSYDNSRLAMIFFFLAGLALQRWAASQRGRWLLASYTLFLICVLTYENAVFLFPALVLMAWPLLPADKRENWRSGAMIFVGLSALSVLILLVPYWLYDFIVQIGLGSVATPVRGFEVGNIFTEISRSAPTVYMRFGQIINFGRGPWNAMVGIGLVAVLVLASAWILRIHRTKETDLTGDARLRWTAIYLAALWFLVFGPLPYILAGFGVGGRVYSSAVFGVFALLVMVYETARQRFVKWTAVALIVLFTALGLLVLFQESMRVNQGEAVENAFYRGLKEAVPHVRSDTVFFILDGPIGNSGCPAGLEMLYSQTDLRCAILSSVYDKYEAIRSETMIETSGQELSGGNWILVLVDGDEVRVLDQIAPGDFDLYITWESTEPISTNFEKIVTEDLPPPSPFYLHLLKRAEVLFPNR